MREVECAALAKARYRGTMMDNVAKAPMGKGHGNKGKPFDVETACYLKPLVAEFHNPRTRKIVELAGVKTLKSLFAEIAAAYQIPYGSGDVGIFFGSGEVADDVSTTRILNYFEGIESYLEMLATVVSRHDSTKDTVKFPGKTLFIKPANLANAQQKNLETLVVQDAFVCGRSGIIQQLIERTTQYPDTKKIILESQGGEEGDDFDLQWKDTDQREIHVRCLHCGQPHIFNWKAFDVAHMRRPDDFVPTPPLSVPSLDRQAWIEHHRPLLLKPDHRVAGFQRGPRELIKNEEGDYNETAVLRETHFTCFHCGGLWRDDGEFGATRIALDRSSHYIPSRLDALPANVGFNFAQWINRRRPWGEIMLEKLKRQDIYRRTGNVELLRQWWQKFAGRVWSDAITSTRETTISVGSYDPTKFKERFGDNFHSANMAVDCQQNQDHYDLTGKSITGWFWYVARAFDKFGNSIQLARGFVKSWEAWVAVQKHWGIPNDRVIIDVLNFTDQVIQKAVEFREIVKLDKPHPIFKTMDKTVTWKLLQASSGRQNFKGHKDGIIRAWSPESPVFGNVLDKDARMRRVPVSRILFNKTPIQQQVDALYSGAPGLPKFEWLKREQLLLPDGTPDKLTLEMEKINRDGKPSVLCYEQQMSAQIYSQDTHRYVELRPDDHYYWCEQALQVRVGMDGLFGHSAVFTTGQDAGAEA